MPRPHNRPSIFDISRSLHILDTLLTKNRSIAEMNFAVNTTIKTARYMQDTLQKAAVETERVAQETRERERSITASNARKQKRVDGLKKRLDARRAALAARALDPTPLKGKLKSRVEKKKPIGMTVFRKDRFAGVRTREHKRKSIIGGVGDTTPNAAEIGSG